MSNLAFYGSPIEYDNHLLINNTNSKNTKNENNIINKKRNKTQKNTNLTTKQNIEPFYSNKVNNILTTINNLPNDDDEENYNFNSQFKPLPPPNSSGVQKTIDNETFYLEQQEINERNIKQNNLQKIIPSIQNMKFPLLNEDENSFQETYYQNKLKQTDNNDNNILINKLNYMIHLLEEKNDEKTNNVMEEVILYSFLGIFIIFLIDSFNHLGRYKR
jgi:hypothetical protein